MAFHYERQIQSSDVDLHRRLRLSRLFTMLEELCMAHMDAMGIGKAWTLDRGFLWVIALQQVRIKRLPVYNERIRWESVPGKTLCGLFPRYSRMCDADGRELLTASSLWTLIHESSRSMAMPEETGILTEGTAADWETFFPRPPRAAVSDNPCSWTVPYSMTDLNGHMNNARYLDLAEDYMPAALRDRSIQEIHAEYASEIRIGESMKILAEQTENSFFFSGFTDKRVFRLRFDYSPEQQSTIDRH